MKSLFRIDNVLRGDAPTVALLGTDGDGRAIRLELPSAAVGSLRQGAVLVLDWWLGQVPPLSSDATATPGASAAPEAAAPAAPADTGAGPSAPRAGERPIVGDDEIDETRLQAEFRVLFGLA
jgi:hypothetical protein